jgi:hypothetical protein
MNDFTCIVGGTGNCWFWDANAFAPVGKLSLGDIDLSDDGLTLFVVNMYDRKLYEIPIGDPPTAPGAGSITAVAMPTSLPNSGPNALPAGSGSNQHQGCAEADVRPMGTGFFDGKLYAGMVCSAQTSKLRTDLRAYVYAYDPATQQFGTAPVVEFPLDYVHGNIATGMTPGDRNNGDWRSWTDQFYSASATNYTADGLLAGDSASCGGMTGVVVRRPQPMLSDIDFDGGTMILGLRDRTADQTGCSAGGTNTSDIGSFYSGFSVGDVLRACPNGTGWTVENNATCGGVTGGGAGNSQGPGGGESYYGDTISQHNEPSWGGLVQVPGFTQVVHTLQDPFGVFGNATTDVYAGGLQWLNNSNGSAAKSYEIYDNQMWWTNLGKAGGLGDLEALSDAAPVEIGNRVWRDANRDGIQDPDEPGINGVTLGLYDAGGNLVQCQLPQTAVEYADNFDAVAYTGSNGAVNWSGTPWVEIGESDGAAAGNVLMTAGNSWFVPVSAPFMLQISNANRGVFRPVNLAGAASAQLTFFYQSNGFDSWDNETVSVAYTTDPTPSAGGAWTVLGNLPGLNEVAPRSQSYILPGGVTGIRFLTSATVDADHYFYIDNVAIAVTRMQTVTAQTTTSGDGNYYIRSCVQPNTAYQVRILNTVGPGQQAPLQGLILTDPNAPQPANGNAPATDNNAVTDVADSDAAMDGTTAVIAISNTTLSGPGANNHGFDFGFAPPPLAAVLADFSATAGEDHILLAWSTVSEIDNQGFNLYRRTEALGAVERINDALIPSQAPGGSQGFAYTWQDSAVAANTTYHYWLEAVDLQGATQRFGPVSATLASPTAVQVTAISASSGAAAPIPAWLLVLLAACAGVLASMARIRRQVRSG